VFADQHELVRRHPQLPEHPELLRALADGTLEFASLGRSILLCFGLAALTAPYLVYLGGAPALLIGIAGVASSLSYAAGPLRYAPRGLADPVFFAMFGVVAVAGAYYIQAHAFPASAFVVGVPVGALVTNVLIIDDLRDREFDAAKGWRTGAVRFGFWRVLGFSAWVLLPLLTLPWAARIARTVCTSGQREALIPMTPRASLLSLAYSLLLAAGLAVS
jgi:1,4-dihydroxy-2-naphthoate octaprenyltransferase